ncbi:MULTISPECIES: hypothetical protein [unclassified Paenibacillus]|uniref:hypothetical protein n=1 Tax=unclassified Paenibacillus TaxID=185978 RepID=UPI0027895C4A|nr:MULTISPECIES: hypothetical protein [unclassified Paenibacillus]MDQ0903481.1 hypothetical protein [Paenibacillus sp. V4I7]MDQ0918041.1 hypothetical protein [Paenibacillus sp. V4I5]
MISMLILYTIFLIGGLMVLNRVRKLIRKELLIFIGVTTVGGVLWGSIIVHHPLDLNKLIALIIDELQ